MKTKSIKNSLEKKLKINYIYPDDLKSNFVSNLVVQHTNESFILSFFELWPPAIISKTAEEQQKEMESIDSVESNCVSRIVITPGKMRDFITAMKNNLDRYDIELKITNKKIEE